MWFVTGLKGTGARLAAFYAVFFVVSVALLGVISVALVDAALRRQVDARIGAEMQRLQGVHHQGGDGALVGDISMHETTERGLVYRLQTADGRSLAGDFVGGGNDVGWFDYERLTDGQKEAPDNFRGLTSTIGGNILTIADDIDEVENTRDILSGVFLIASFAAALLAVVGGIGLSKYYLKNLNQLATTAEVITGGDMQKRMPMSRDGDEFDRLSTALNQMLDRNADLLESQRQITNDIAHDIRTPLTRLRQKLEAGATDTALEETDNLLRILGSLLRIAELEEGQRRLNFVTVDLVQILQRIEDAYAAPFENAGKHLRTEFDTAVVVHGDPNLLTQLVSNLAENVLSHTPAGTRALLHVQNTPRGATLCMIDDGPGVADPELTLLFRRFYRGDASRSISGNGLGLSLVNAIAGLHGADVNACNLNPGFEIRVNWKATGINEKPATAIKM
jgi:signal transduction histidine kinase